MTLEATVSTERAIGRMETAIASTKEQVGTLTVTVESNFKDLRVDMAAMWASIRLMQQEMVAERGARETVFADARAARETLAAAALIAQAKTAQDAIETADTKATFETMKADAIAAAAETARTVLAIDAKEAKRAIGYETDERRIQTHWLVERIGTVLPWLVPLLIAGAAYMLGIGHE